MALQTFRALGKTWFFKGVMLVLILSFAAWGIGDYLHGGNASAALKIADQDIPAANLDRVVQFTLQQFNQLGIDRDQLNQAGLATQVIAEQMRRATLLQVAADTGLGASRQELLQRVQNSPFLQSQNLTPETYQATLRTLGFSVEGFEAELVKDLTYDTFANLFMVPHIPGQLVQQRALENLQTLDVLALELTPTALTVATPDIATLQAFYASNTQLFLSPEERAAHILTLDVNQIARQISISDADIAAEYAQNQARYTTPERRTVRHMLFADATTAQTVATQLAAGESFSKLAVAHKGANLGALTRAEVDAAVADVIFNLELDAISAPTPSPLGVHLFQVTAITPAQVQPLADVQAQIAANLRLTTAEQTYYDLLEQLEDAVAGQDDIAEIAQNIGIPLETLTLTADETKSAANLRQAIFATPLGRLSGGITPEDLSPQGVAPQVFFTVHTITDPAPLPFTDVQAQVAQAWTQQQQQAKYTEVVAALGQAIAVEKNPLRDALTSAALTLKPKQYNGLKRGASTMHAGSRTDDDPFPAFAPDQRATVLRGQPGNAFAFRSQQGVLYVELLRASQPQPTTADLATTRAQMQEQLLNETAGNFIASQLSTYRIDYNLPLLRAVFGETFTVDMIPGFTKG